MNASLSFAWLFCETRIPDMAKNRTGLTAFLFGGLIIGATAFVVALPASRDPGSMGTGVSTRVQVRHHAVAVLVVASDVLADADDADGRAVGRIRAQVPFRAIRLPQPGAGRVAGRRFHGVSTARFLERAGRLACPSTAPPRAFA